MAKNTPVPNPDSSTSLVPIVAIGASAGGQEAVVELLQNLSPTTGLAYVYIQHLDPMQDSRLADILSRATAMQVHEAEHLMRIEPNQFYIIPPDRDLEVLDGVLTLVPRTARSIIHMPIDQFFLSLAQRQKGGAIAIVLSGAASDGTLGLRAIKSTGGITFAQDETARFQSMPRSAIAEGVVDRVLSPAGIAHELERLSHQTSIFQQTILTESQEAESAEASIPEPAVGSDEDLKSIIQLLRRATGVDFSHYKVTTIRRRIIRRTLLYKLDSLGDYAEYLRQHPEEATLLYDDLLINVTNFFRDTETMDYIQKVLFPQLLRDKPVQEPIRIWVPACSTGQEAYSLAILLLEVLGERALSRPIQLFATDLSESAVAKARMGSYTRGEMMDVSPGRLQRFFTKVDDHYWINKSVRDLCVFAPHNLLKDPPFSRLDLISCRNLLIYLDSTLQRKAITTFHYALTPSGYLILGKSETVGSSAPLFSQLEKNYKVFSRKNDVDSRASFTMSPRQLDNDRGMYRPLGLSKSSEQTDNTVTNRTALPGPVSDLDKVVDNLLLSQYVPASVVVNQDLEILQFRGSTGLFLEPSPGKASLNLIKMARPSLVFELRNVIHKAQKLGASVRKSGLEVKLKTTTHYVAIEAIPLDTATEERLFLVIFDEIEPPVVPVTRSADARNRRIKELETELANLREDMRSIIEEQEASNEELQSANEEIISSNEELQSINEELETSKEEIESTNEELLTINQELQVRNDQLSESYQFAEDIFGTIREATLVLDTDLRVKSANPAFYKLFKLNDEDTERRLIYELGNRQWDIPELRLMLTDIITSDVQFLGFELTYRSVETGEKILSLNARRVVRQQESILLAIEDITEHRRAQRLLAEREAWFHQIADNAPTLIWVTDANGRITFLNKVWLAYTGRTMEDVMEQGLTLGMHPDDQPGYRQQYDTSIRERAAFSSEYRLRRHDGNYHWMLENAQPIFSRDDTFAGYIGSSVDIQLQKEATLEMEEMSRRIQERTLELEQISARLSQAQIIARIGSFERNFATGTLLVSDEMYHLFGYEPGSITFTVELVDQQTHPDDRDAINVRIEAAKQDCQPFTYVRRIYRPDGQLRYLYNQHEVSCDEAGNPLGFIGIAQDITDRIEVELQLQQTAQNLQAVLNSSPASIGFFKAVRDEEETIIDFRLMVCNQEFAQVFGQPIQQLIGQLVSQLSTKLWQEHTVETICHVLETGEPFGEERYDSSTDLWMNRTLTKYGDDVLLTSLDVTALKTAEQQQEYLLNELEKSNEDLQILTQLRQHIQERSELLRSTSHDLRGNFGIIQGAATLLDMAKSDEERAQMLDMLQRNLRQATQMLTELLDVARLEAGQEERQITSFDVAELLAGLVESAQPLASERGLWLRSEGSKSLIVEGDNVKIHRIAQNLLLNALKYTKTGGVTVRWETLATDRWQLLIADTGPGLPQNKGKGQGEGIGLLITKQLCDLLDCHMDIDSQPGVGTHFRLSFPQHYPA